MEQAPAGTVLAPKNAFEIGVEGGYTQPFGMIDQSRNINDFAKAGGAVGLSLAYRMSPLFAIGATGQYHESVAASELGADSSMRGVAAGLQAAFHFMPYRVLDPYATLGTGYRVMWMSPQNGVDSQLHGFEILKGQVGLDFRVDKSVALGPVAGADLNLFVWDRASTTGINATIPSKSVNTFIFAGVGGKFDLGGERVPEHPVIVPTPAAAPAVAREVQPAAPEAPPAPAPEAAPPSTGVSIDEEILAACHIS